MKEKREVVERESSEGGSEEQWGMGGGGEEERKGRKSRSGKHFKNNNVRNTSIAALENELHKAEHCHNKKKLSGKHRGAGCQR